MNGRKQLFMPLNDMDDGHMLNIHVKLFKPDSKADCVGPSYQRNLQNFSNCTIQISPESLLEAILVKCAEKCDITPIYLSLFGLKDSDTGSWLNLALTVSEYVTRKTSQSPICLEFRVRFIFTNDCPGTSGQQQLAYRYSVEKNRKHDVMNDAVLLYLFYQQRDDFREGKLKLSVNVLDEDSANLGIAVLDILRLACELKMDLQSVIRHISLKKLVSHTYCDRLSSKHMLRKMMIRHRFRHYVTHFETRYRQCLNNNSSALYFHVKYLKNLEILIGSQNMEVFEVITKSDNPEECNKISVGPYSEIVKHSKSDASGTKWCRFADIADVKLSFKDVNSQGHWTVTLIHMSGEVLSLVMPSLNDAENLATCIDGYYHLLVDSHHYLCKQVCRPSLVKQLDLSCHGPISSAFAVHVLKCLPSPQVGNCLLRCSYEKYDEYFINTIVDVTPDREVIVRNFKIVKTDGLFGVYGDDNLMRRESLTDLLEECEHPFQNDLRLPFNVARLVYPTVAQPNALLVHINEIEDVLPTPTDMTIIPQGAYKFQQHLGGGRFTEVTLYSKRDQRSDEVVVKKVYDCDHPGQQQQIESSFEDSMIRFKQLNNWMDGDGKNKNIHVVQLKGTIMSNNLVLEYVPLGSITKYAQTHREHPGTEWIMSVIWQLSNACSYLEDKGCAHGNIRGKNVLLKHDGDHPFIKLSDPGVSTCQKTVTYSHKTKILKEPTLSAPWLAYEYCSVDYDPTTENPTVNGDKWSFASTVCEICYWSASINVLRPYNAFDLSHELKVAYRTQSAVLLPGMLLAPELGIVAKLLKKCWSIWPQNRPAFRHIMQELGAISSDFEFESNDPGPVDAEEPMPDLDVYDDQNLMNIRQLGRGHFGHVDLCQYDRCRNGEIEKVAVKSLIRNFNNPQTKNDLYNEIQAMRQIHHRYVVKLKGVTFPSVRIVMEYLACGSLKSYLSKKKSSGVPLVSLFYNLYEFCRQISEGMQALQEHRLIHRDLALRNILLDKDSDRNLYVKISDFGLSRVLGEEESYYRGSLDQFPALWYAPECLIPDRSFRFESDVWSFGVTIWQMFSYGAAPQYASQKSVGLGQIGKLCQILQDGERLNKPVDCPQTVYDIMMRCWKYNPQERIRFDALQESFSSLVYEH